MLDPESMGVDARGKVLGRGFPLQVMVVRVSLRKHFENIFVNLAFWRAYRSFAEEEWQVSSDNLTVVKLKILNQIY